MPFRMIEGSINGPLFPSAALLCTLLRDPYFLESINQPGVAGNCEIAHFAPGEKHVKRVVFFSFCFFFLSFLPALRVAGERVRVNVRVEERFVW